MAVQQGNKITLHYKAEPSNDADQIQCIVSKNLIENSIVFGQTQQPKLWDYADNLDTLAFLSNI